MRENAKKRYFADFFPQKSSYISENIWKAATQALINHICFRKLIQMAFQILQAIIIICIWWLVEV